MPFKAENKQDYTKLRSIKRANVSKAFVEEQSEDLKNSIKSVPTIIIFRNGKPIARLEAGLSMKIETKLISFPEGIVLKSGDKLDSFDLMVETYGELNELKTNAVLVCHAFSGNHIAAGKKDDVTGWWNQIIGPDKAINTNDYFVVCCNNLGGCSGSSGPTTMNPATNKPFGVDFPQVTVDDWVNSQKMLMDKLDIPYWHLVAGGSLGGMQALQWSVAYPDKVKKL